MSKIEDLKKELAELEAKEKEDQEIKDLQKKINAKKFGKSKSGKIFNKIADAGDNLGKAILGSGKKGSPVKKPQKRQDLNELIKNLPQ